MEPDLQFSVLCDDVRREDNGKFIFVGLFESIAATQFPIRHPRLFIANRWCNGEGSFKEKTRIIAPDKDSVITSSKEISFTLKNTTSHHNVINTFYNLLFQSQGTYWVEIMLDDKMKLRYPLHLVKKEKK